jgi:hypothetical protein
MPGGGNQSATASTPGKDSAMPRSESRNGESKTLKRLRLRIIFRVNLNNHETSQITLFTINPLEKK